MTDLGTFLGNCILIVTGVVIFCDNTADLGYAAILGIVVMLGAFAYELMTNKAYRHRIKNRFKK
ncbi:hypothetical protein A6M27_13245 [Acidithiobacillus thiooxidans]|uniref:Uncharacterized protein n=1 Tax=Acidithiobacillus thiooxidans TaxID=930 RepID=A0A1C2JBG5_ACITH|nr:hypothetical protein [Acidithiobacillus thiooxidans]OCX67474.1 hypothetical protein A6O24_20780 [Acidithiobacillus thiooxidans]OCX76917.1 hypothetical protein A6P07_01255 [Acidithiobacillus thiooxidans]OCX85591.1 hypothetical protein A6O26_00765 [Acidithiobacillus thiooxidans]OCX86257.1 hypothetical protein A6M27_13245 [Acidithiobacillus thiooxidans]OFC50716.1 hypothetical protein BAE47_01330 [Acidithiobacillus thiooxidans]